MATLPRPTPVHGSRSSEPRNGSHRATAVDKKSDVSPMMNEPADSLRSVLLGSGSPEIPACIPDNGDFTSTQNRSSVDSSQLTPGLAGDAKRKRSAWSLKKLQRRPKLIRIIIHVGRSCECGSRSRPSLRLLPTTMPRARIRLTLRKRRSEPPLSCEGRGWSCVDRKLFGRASSRFGEHRP